MNDLDSVLKKYSGSEVSVFTDDGKFTSEGYNTYCNFCSMDYGIYSNNERSRIKKNEWKTRKM